MLGNVAAQSARPCAGMQARAIKALSADQIADLKAGRGMSLALAAELNGYPGPHHVLELGDQLGLADQQRADVQRLFYAMTAEAIPLGEKLVAQEAELDALFARRAVTATSLGAATAAIGAIQAELRRRLKPAVLFEVSPVGVSLTEPVTLKGPPNSFCSVLSEGSHFSSVLEILAPNDMLVSVGKTLNRSDWLLVQPWSCVVALGSGLVTARPFCRVAVTFSPTDTERLNVVPTLLCCCDGSTRVSIEVWSQPSGN
jgi:hypothetical protein